MKIKPSWKAVGEHVAGDYRDPLGKAVLSDRSARDPVDGRFFKNRGLKLRVLGARIAGPGALDSEQHFFDLAPSLTARDYLLTVFRKLSSLPGAEQLLGPRHNPAWSVISRS